MKADTSHRQEIPGQPLGLVRLLVDEVVSEYLKELEESDGSPTPLPDVGE